MVLYIKIWEFPKLGLPYLGVLIIRLLLFRVLYWGPPVRLLNKNPVSAAHPHLHCSSGMASGTADLETKQRRRPKPLNP